MTIDDGHVIGLQQFHGTAPRHSAFNVLLMADGFTQDQQDDFDDACKRFRDSLLKAVPFNQLKNKINIFGLNVASRDSGVSDTRHHFVRRFTYFDALFDAGSEWVLICEERHAMETAAEWLPEPHVAIVMANTAEYGGSGRPGVAVCSMHPNSALIALHEMGHSAFGLADEYGTPQGTFDEVGNLPPGGEPSEPNVTRARDLATLKALKWGAAVTTAKLPTMANPHCTRKEEERNSEVAHGTVGLFEGARYVHCGIYRPEYSCRMRDLREPFCTVCQQVIVRTFASFSV